MTERATGQVTEQLHLTRESCECPPWCVVPLAAHAGQLYGGVVGCFVHRSVADPPADRDRPWAVVTSTSHPDGPSPVDDPPSVELVTVGMIYDSWPVDRARQVAEAILRALDDAGL